jgi:hypothetical protein
MLSPLKDNECYVIDDNRLNGPATAEKYVLVKRDRVYATIIISHRTLSDRKLAIRSSWSAVAFSAEEAVAELKRRNAIHRERAEKTLADIAEAEKAYL